MNEEDFDKEKQNKKMNEKQFQQRNFEHAKSNWHSGGLLKKLWMIVLSIIVGGGIIVALVVGILGMYVVMGCIIGALFVFVPLLILFAIVNEKLHLSKKNINWNVPAIEGVVKTCVLHTEIAKGGNEFDEAKHNSQHKVETISSVYQLKVDINGKIKTVYDYKPYNAGDKISLRQHKILKNILLVE